MFKRTRRLRKNTIVRKMLQNVHLSLDDLIYPIFVKEGAISKRKFLPCRDNIDILLIDYRNC